MRDAGQERKRRQLVVLVVLGAAVLTVLAGLVAGGMPAAGARGPVVGILRIEGEILGGRSADGLWGPAVGADDVLALLREAREDPAVRAVVVRLNTPGGSAAAAQEIGAEIQRLRREGKVVVASLGDVAASGGYWIAATADRIVASPATLTGSIGVITQVATLVELYRKLGIEVETIKTGPYKDTGSPSRRLTDAERRLLQAMVDDIFQQFVDVVATGRGLPRERVLAVADGRILTGRQAHALGLVDELGTLEDAIERAAELAGIGGGYAVRELGGRGFLEQLLERIGGARRPAWWPVPRWDGGRPWGLVPVPVPAGR